MKKFLSICIIVVLIFAGKAVNAQTGASVATGSNADVIGPFEIIGIDSKSITFKATTKGFFYNVAFISGDQILDATFISNTEGNIVFSSGATVLPGSQLRTPKANNWKNITMELQNGTIATCSFTDVPPGFAPQRVMLLTSNEAAPLYFNIPEGSVIPANSVKYEDEIFTVSLGTINKDGRGNVAVEILTDEKLVIPMKNGVLTAPIMMRIEAGDRTFTAGDNVSIQGNSMVFNFTEVPDKIIVYGNDGNTDNPVVTFDVKKGMVKKTEDKHELATTSTAVKQPQQPQAPKRPTETAAQQATNEIQQTRTTQQPQTETVITQKNTKEDKWRRWYLEAGLTILPVVPKEIDAIVFAGGAFNAGFFANPHHRLSLDVGVGVYSREKIGTFEYTKSYESGKTEHYTDGVIDRDYTATTVLFSYNYVFTLSEKFHLRLGASLGATAMSATLGLKPNVDNLSEFKKEIIGSFKQYDLSDKTESMAVVGLGFGVTWNFARRWFLDGGYKTLINSGLQIDDFEVSAPAHQINIAVGWRF